MNIDIYSTYDVVIKGKSCSIDPENSEPDDYYYNHDEIINNITISGGQLLDMIAKKLNDNYICEFNVGKGKIHFEIFNYNNGESEKYDFYIEKKDLD